MKKYFLLINHIFILFWIETVILVNDRFWAISKFDEKIRRLAWPVFTNHNFM